MWRTILLGKMSVSILASLVVGSFCVSQPWRNEYSLFESSRWIGVGVFLLAIGVSQIAVLYFLTKRK